MTDMAERKKRIGIYGGTFSPPHIGHVAAAKAFLEALPLDSLLIIPTLIPPHKKVAYRDDPQARLEMCRLAFGDLKNTEVSELEILRGGKSYTSDTLRVLSGDDRELFLLCGTDMILTLDEWHEPNTIFSLSTPVCIRRENDKVTGKDLSEAIERYKNEYGVTVPMIDAPAIEVSSSEIRERISTGLTTDGLVPEKVGNYIKEHRLYHDIQ